MAEYELLEQRVVSGLGNIRLPNTVEDYRQIIWVAEVLRDPRNQYLNGDWFPEKSLYARVVFDSRGDVVNSCLMEFPNMRWIDTPDVASQALIATQCAYKGILQTFFNLGNALLLPSISIQNDISAYTTLLPTWDRMIFKCYGDTALRLSVYTLNNDRCGSDSGDSQNPLTTPVRIPRPEVVPIGTPVQVSPPYPTVGNLYEPTEPFEGDTEPPPQPCVTIIRGRGIEINTCTPLSAPFDATWNGYAELVPSSAFGCPGLRVFLDGVDQGLEATYFPDAVIVSRSGDCEPPGE